MSKLNLNSTKNTYTRPIIECVSLDSDISLQLESLPPAGPGESFSYKAPEFFNNTQHKENVC